MPDEFIIQNLHNRINDSVDYFNGPLNFNLRNKRIKNMRMIRGDQIDENILYHYQTPYKDNELFVGVDAMIAYITASIAQPEVYPADKTKYGKILAADLLTYMKCHSEIMGLDAELEAVTLDLLAQYVGVLTIDWNPLYGGKGELIPRRVNPINLIVDKNVRRGQNPAFICEVMKDSIEGLIAKFPKKEQEIMKIYGIKRKGLVNVSKELAYRQVKFTYYEDNKPEEAICWYIQNLVLDKRKDPNWLYEGEGENFLNTHHKMYIPFNLFNEGSHWIDFTSAVENAVPVQDILNKEGRQIIDNLSTANGFRIVLAGAMSDDALENLTGDPNQSVIVKAKPGQSIDDIYKQIEPHLVSAELIADKNNNRDVLHSILGTPSQFRGDDADQTKTASEAILIKNQASGRQDKIIRAMNRGLGEYYRCLAQMITVWYTDAHTVTAEGGDGTFDFVEMHQDKVKKGMTIRVYDQPSGDKARQEAKAQNAAELQFLAPVDYYKQMHMDNPQKLYDNLVKWKTQPQELAMDINNQDEDREAIADFATLMKGDKPEPRDDITPEYLDQLRKEMISDDFLFHTKKKIQDRIIQFVQASALRLGIRTELDEVSEQPEPLAPLPPQIQATIPAPPQVPMQPQMPQTGGMPLPQVGQAPMPMPPGAGQGLPGAPAAPPGPLPPAPMAGGPQIGVPGIQGIMQTVAPQGAPNLSPTAQPQAPTDIGSLTPR